VKEAAVACEIPLFDRSFTDSFLIIGPFLLFFLNYFIDYFNYIIVRIDDRIWLIFFLFQKTLSSSKTEGFRHLFW